MNRRLLVALVLGLGLWLWRADRVVADSMSGGGVSSSGSQPWIGNHNNMPRQTLSPAGTVFTPPTSFGNYWIVNNAAGQSVACPPDIADGDSMNIHIQYGAGAPYSPAIAFSTPCYGWTSGVQPTWSEAPTQSDSAFCQSMNPADVSGVSFVCAPQLNAKPPVLTPTIVQTNSAIGNGTGSTSINTSLTGSFTASHTAMIMIGWCGDTNCAPGTENITTVTATGATCTLIAGTNSGVSVPIPAAMYRCTGVSAGTPTFTVNWGATAFWQSLFVAELSNDNGVEAGNVASGSSAAPSVTSGTLTQTSNELAIAFSDTFDSTTGVNSPFIFIKFTGGGVGYYVPPSCSSCTVSPTFTRSGTNAWTVNIAAIKHP